MTTQIAQVSSPDPNAERVYKKHPVSGDVFVVAASSTLVMRNGNELYNNEGVYQDEGEWLLNEKVLNVPTGSTLYIMLPSISDEQRANWEDPQQQKIEGRKQLVNKYGLDRLYRIRYVDDKNLSEQKSQYFQRREQNSSTSQGNVV